MKRTCLVLLLCACSQKKSPPAATYTLSADVQGLNAGTVTLANGAASIPLSANGVTVLATAQKSGAAYAVTVSKQPGGQTCSVTDGAGTFSNNVTVAVSCSALAITALSLAPATAQIAVGATQTFIATATFTDHSTSAGVAVWSSSAPSVASIDANGVATGVANGTTTLTATAGGQSATAALSVGPTLAITPANPFIAAGFPAKLTLTETLPGGTTASPTTTWTSSDPTRIAIAADGTATFVKVPTSDLTITAAADGVTATVSIAGARVAFTSTETGSAIFGSWADAGGNTGVAAADAVCNTLGAPFGGPPFVALVSDSVSDVYCRLQGLTGTYAASCGQSTRPTNAGPWLRSDGFPFSTLSAAPFYTPLMLDETGAAIADSLLSFTGSEGDAVSDLGTCNDWTTAGITDTACGRPYGTQFEWSTTTCQCNTTSHLICLQTGAGPALPPFQQPGKIAFGTSATGDGNLSDWPQAGGNTGLAAGDAICQTLAASAGLANASAFKAWLSDDSTNAIDRLTSDGPWVNPDGVPFAANKAALTAGSTFTSLFESESKRYGTAAAWTGTDETGNKITGKNCSGWTSNVHAVQGAAGDADEARAPSISYALWSDNGAATGCDFNEFSLYCFEDD